MSNKFKLDYYHKHPQSTSPYMQLLEAKKKIFGYKYEIIHNDKSISHHNKSVNQGQPSHKYSKTQSHQKEKPKSQKQHSRKKRSHTEQAEERLHQSLFLNREMERSHSKEGKHQATKSLFNVEGSHDHSINPLEFVKNYRNLLGQGGQEDRGMKCYTQQVETKKEKVSHPLDKLQINEIDDLINLIDKCVEESNDYIAYLTQKIESMKGDIESMREENIKILKMKDGIINEKEHQIDRLKKQLFSLQYNRTEQEKGFEIKKLLEIVDKVTQENTALKSKLQKMGIAEGSGLKNNRGQLQKQKKQIYSQIHNKIDILNISIDKKNQENANEPQLMRQSKKGKFNKAKFYK